MPLITNRTITITKGQEYSVCQIDLKEEANFFHDVYLKAIKCVDEIQAANPKPDSEKGSDSLKTDSINNIIAFCGERGQGKTSAMLSFSKTISEDNKHKYYVMNAIDPTNIEKNDNILMLILSCIFRDFKRKWKDCANESSRKRDSQKDRILELFNKAYHHISTIKSPSSDKAGKFADFDDIMNTLDRYGDSTELCNVFQELFSEFLDFIDYEKDSFFVIQIDDTDLNIDRAYEIVEDIRKYLSIPKVIVLMATKFEQLSKIIEQNYINNLKVLYEKNKVADAEISSMASKYLEKLIPETKRIYLPSLDMGDLSAQLPTVKYEDENKNSIIGEGDIQKQIIDIIDSKTGISFDLENLNGIIHPIIPRTMRELVTFLAFISSLEDIKADENAVDIDKVKIRYTNITAFYRYFKTNWIQSHLENDDIERMDRIIKAQINTTHMQTLLEIRDKLNGLDESIKNIKIKDNEGNNKSDSLIGRINKIIENQASSNTYSYSLGNIMDSLVVLDENVKSINMINFTFAIKTVYTIKMMTYSINDLLAKNTGNGLNNLSVLHFIGTDYIGKYCVSTLFPNVVKTKYSRGRFDISINKFTDCLKNKGISPVNMDDILDTTKNYLGHFIFQGYSSSDYDYFQIQSPNNRKFNRLFCNISYYFISLFEQTLSYYNGEIYIFLNFEKLINIVSNQIKIKDKKKREATLQNMYISFLETFKNYPYVQNIINILRDDKIYIVALDDCIKDMNNKDTDSNDHQNDEEQD